MNVDYIYKDTLTLYIYMCLLTVDALCDTTRRRRVCLNSGNLSVSGSFPSRGRPAIKTRGFLNRGGGVKTTMEV